MALIRRLFLFCCCLVSSVYAVGEPLNVGIEGFSPPFVLQAADRQMSGFDIDLMNSLCKIMKRTCVFKLMRFDQLIPAIIKNQVDASIGAITITSARSKLVNFSLPYLLSYSRFLTRRTTDNPVFSLELLNNKTIGVETGTIFSTQINEIGIHNPKIKEYPKEEELLEALNAGKVDFILMDNAAATYWEANSERIKTIGPPYMYGYGLGIAVDPGNGELLTSINNALLQYQNSPEFKANYNKYLMQF